MRLKKFNEYSAPKSLTKEDLGMWLRKGDMINIISHDGVHKNGKYQVIDFGDAEIEVTLPDTNKNFWLSVDDLNDRWELISINDEPIMITEENREDYKKPKLRPLTQREVELLKSLNPRQREKYLKQRKD